MSFNEYKDVNKYEHHKHWKYTVETVFTSIPDYSLRRIWLNKMNIDWDGGFDETTNENIYIFMFHNKKMQCILS